MVAEKNIIKKLTVEVDTNSMAMALQLKDNLDTFFKEKIYPILDTIFSEIHPKNTIQRFKTIELNIDLQKGEKLEEIKSKIINQILKEISKKRRTKIEEESTIYTSKNMSQNSQEAFLFFLKNGQYPWWFHENTQCTMDDIKGIDPSTLKSIISSSNNLNRLLYQFDIDFITEIFFNAFNIDRNPIKTLGKIPSLLQIEPFKIDFLRWIFQYKLTSHPAQFSDSFFNLIDALFTKRNIENGAKSIQKNEFKKLLNLFQFCNENLAIPIQFTTSKTRNNTYTISIIESLKIALKSNENITNTIDKNKGVFFIKIGSSPTPFLEQNLVQKIDEKAPQNLTVFEEKKDDSLTDGILLKNAGLVLIHPFIKHFFEKLEFLSEGKIKNEKLDEAVHVLHYLACKQEQPQEHILLFEKFLCNIPLQYPIKRYIKLTNRQKEACEELLQAMLSHWQGLKTKNTAVLRNEFLMREGKLQTTNDRDSLYIQRKTQDILLDSIPWNFHLVKIPWKKKLVFVEW